MQCLILAGGLGTRMKEISKDLPKALLPIGPKPFIDWQLLWLKANGIDKVIMALGHGGEFIQDHIQKSPDLNFMPVVEYSFDGPELLGTGGAIVKAKALLDEDFLVTYGDTFLTLNVSAMFKTHLASKKALTMAILKNENIGDKSNVIYKGGPNLFYDKFNRTAEMDYIDYGILTLNKRDFFAAAPGTKFDLSLFMAQATKENNASAFVVGHRFYEIGSPQGYQEFVSLLKSHQFKLPPPPK